MVLTLERRHHAQLVIRRRPGEEHFAEEGLLEVVLAHRGHLVTVDDPNVGTVQQTDPSGDRLGGEAVVASDHDRADPGPMAGVHGVGDLGAGRIHHRDEPEKRQLGLELLGRAVDDAVELAPGDGEHAQPTAAHVVVGLGDACPQGVVERTVGTVDTGPDAQADELPRGTLRVEHLVTVDPVQRAHPLAARVEGQLVDPGGALARGVEIDPCLASGDFDRGLGRVAEHRPAVIRLDQSGVARQRPGDEDETRVRSHSICGRGRSLRNDDSASLPRGRSRRHRSRTGRRA